MYSQGEIQYLKIYLSKGGISLIQTVVWFATLFFILLIAGVFLWVAIKSKEESSYEPVVKKWYKARSIYGVLLVILMLVVTIYTLRELQIGRASCRESMEDAVVARTIYEG